MILYWDKDGTPLETLEWAHKFEDYDYRFVGHNHVGPYRISTLWMGLPPTYHWFHPEGPAAVFETAVFRGRAEDQRRHYVTEADALAGHQETVMALWVICLFGQAPAQLQLTAGREPG
jgi:hypothetical protein